MKNVWLNCKHFTPVNQQKLESSSGLHSSLTLTTKVLKLGEQLMQSVERDSCKGTTPHLRHD